MRVVIIGTGLAGQLVLRGLRQGGLKDKVILLSKHSGDFYSKPSLSNVVDQDKTPDDLIAMPVSEVEKMYNCEILEKEVVRIDRENKKVVTKDEEIPYDVLVLGVGAKWVALPMLPNDPKIFRVNHIDDYRKFYKALKPNSNVVVIGGGFIGVEFAYDIANSCQNVTLIERNTHLLSRMVPKEVGQYVENGLRKRGVDVRLGSDINSIEIGDKVSIDIGDRIEADMVLAAVGLQSEVELAKDAGLEVSEGITVNQFGQSSDSSIYALGDCAEVCGLIRRFVAPLKICAKTVSDHIMGKDNPVVYPPLLVNLKTPDIPVSICILSLPKSWEISEDEKGIEALAYDDETLVGFVLSGDKVKNSDSLKAKLKPWLKG